ncbi:MAG: hypothetical protein RL491_891 [Bacteroidota bacterium]
MIVCISICELSMLNAQNVGIGTTTPNSSAKLDISDTNTGILIPRVSLSATNLSSPVISPATSLLVYNTATAGVAPNNVTPGFHYWDGSRWVRLLNSESSDWKVNGNSGTTTPVTPATYGTSTFGSTENWFGTADAQDFVFGTNSIERMRVKQGSGFIGMGTASPTTTLEINSGLGDALYGHSNNVGAYLGRETNFSFGATAQNLLGAGLYATNPTAGYTSIFSQSTGSATVAANISYSNVWMSSYNLVDNASSTYNPSANYSQLNVTSPTLTGTQIALRGYNNRPTTGNPGYSVGVQGISNSQNQDAFGVQGIVYSNTNVRSGGYFEALNFGGTSQAYAYVGTSVNGTNRKITGTNSVSEIIPTANHGRVMMTCPESPEYWYQDYGTVTLVNGTAHIELDEILKDIIVVDSLNPIRAFFTPNNMAYFNGVTIMNQTPNGFDIVELNGGQHSGVLHYQLAVKPKTNFGEGRFPQAPGPAYLKSNMEPAAAKAKNQPSDGRKVFSWPADHEVYNYNPEEMVSIGDVVPAGPNMGKIKLGNGLFGDGVPAEKPGVHKK